MLPTMATVLPETLATSVSAIVYVKAPVLLDVAVRLKSGSINDFVTSLNVMTGSAFAIVNDTVLEPMKCPVPVMVSEAVPALVLLAKLTV